MAARTWQPQTSDARRIAKAVRRVEAMTLTREGADYGTAVKEAKVWALPVLLTQTGGSAGSGTSGCTFTYTVKNMDGTTLATGVTPDMQRAAIGLTVAAAIGWAFYDGSRVLRLWWCDEVPARVKRSC